MSEVRTGTAASGKRKGIIMTLAGASCWGLSGSVGQYLFSVENMDSRWLVPVRLGAAGIILLLFCFIRFGKEQTLAPWKDRKKARTLLVYGIAGVSACQFLYFLTIQLSNAAMGRSCRTWRRSLSWDTPALPTGEAPGSLKSSVSAWRSLAYSFLRPTARPGLLPYPAAPLYPASSAQSASWSTMSYPRN